MHCLEQTSEPFETGAGASLYSDGFYAAEELRRQSPLMWRLLCKTQIAYRDFNTDVIGAHYMLHQQPSFKYVRNNSVNQWATTVHILVHV